MRETGLDSGVETLGVYFLHELETREGCLGDGGPPYSTGVVDEHIDSRMEPYCFGD